MIYLKLLAISFIICFIIDYSGVIQEIEERIKVWLKLPFFHIGKPLSCSLCGIWWIGIIYLLCTGNFTIFNLCYVAFLSAFSSKITDLLYTVYDITGKMIEVLSKIAQ